MFKTIVFIFCILFPLTSFGEDVVQDSTSESGYGYIIEKYFSKKNRTEYSKRFSLFSGISFYRESAKIPFNPFSSFVLGFNQRIEELPQWGADISLQVSLFSTHMARQKSALLEISPRISFPEVQSAFPLYVGCGAGMGFHPRYIVRKISAMSFNSQFFMGLRFIDFYYNLGFFTEFNLRMHYPLSELEIYLETFGHLGITFGF